MTHELLLRAQNGDSAALDLLMTRYRPRLERWASGRLPGYARSLFDTADLVQETLLRALQRLTEIEVQGPGTFQAYVREAILNRIRDQLRRTRARPTKDLTEHLEDRAPSPLENAIGADIVGRYEHALAQLNESDRRLVHLRVELDFSYPEIAAIMERTPDAVRMASRRALTKLAEIMGREL
jgi:RNA polymerase sigma-70 factor, ECF subfamily